LGGGEGKNGLQKDRPDASQDQMEGEGRPSVGVGGDCGNLVPGGEEKN